MRLIFSQYIEKRLAGATYEYDATVKRWAAWIDGVPGVYAQGKTVEDTRDELASVLEDYALSTLAEGKRVPRLVFSKRVHAKAA